MLIKRWNSIIMEHSFVWKTCLTLDDSFMNVFGEKIYAYASMIMQTDTLLLFDGYDWDM